MNRKLLTTGILLIMLCITQQAISMRRVLNIAEVNIAPNPFTPHSNYSFRSEEQGARIGFRVETLSRFVWITVRIHNLRGNVVRTIADLEWRYTDAGDKYGEKDIELWWDGKNDFGEYANNGRYLVHIKVSDTEAQTFSTEELRTVVLVK